jgi:hypothetical protein
MVMCAHVRKTAYSETLARWSIQIRLVVRHAQPLLLSEETCKAEESFSALAVLVFIGLLNLLEKAKLCAIAEQKLLHTDHIFLKN